METVKQAINRLLTQQLQRERRTSVMLGSCRHPLGHIQHQRSTCPLPQCEYLAVGRSLEAVTAAVEEHRKYQADVARAAELLEQWASDMTRPAGGTQGGANV